jgi:hypothetical protein
MGIKGIPPNSLIFNFWVENYDDLKVLRVYN